MKLYGTLTSPFVRRVRIVCDAVGEPVERVDTRGDAGQALLKQVSPLWKVPTAVFDDGAVAWNSRAIVDELVRRRGWGELAAPRDPLAFANALDAIDAFTDSGVNVYLLRLDGVVAEQVPYLQRQLARMQEIARWLEGEVAAGRIVGGAGLDYVGVALITSVAWAAFRAVVPLDDVPAVRAFVAAEGARFASSEPSA